ncbi:MAG: 50S ribosomal protein L10 [Thermoanaerobaculia bacterium]
MNRTEKNQVVETLSREIGQATNAFLIEFKGVTVPQVTELRRQVRESGSSYLVVKNTLALIALKDSPMIELREKFLGETAVAYNQGDAVALAKALTKFAKDVPAISFKGAMLDGRVVAAEQISAIANLPSREELVSQLLFLLQTPMRGLVTVLQANIRNLAIVLDQISTQRGGGSTEEASETTESTEATEAPAPAEADATES